MDVIQNAQVLEGLSPAARRIVSNLPELRVGAVRLRVCSRYEDGCSCRSCEARALSVRQKRWKDDDGEEREPYGF